MPIEAFTAEPLKMAIVNLSEGERLDAQYNPMELNETIGAAYARLVVPGNSHTVKQFTNTEDDTFDFTLVWTSTNGGLPAREELQRAYRFLKSMVRPRENAGTIETGGAPRAMFIWPNFLSLTCTIDKLKFNHQKFNLLGRPVIMSVAVTLSEIRDVIITSEMERDGIDPQGKG